MLKSVKLSQGGKKKCVFTPVVGFSFGPNRRMSLSLCRISVSVCFHNFFHPCNIRCGDRQFSGFNKVRPHSLHCLVLFVGAGETVNTGQRDTFLHGKQQSRPHLGKTRPAECGFPLPDVSELFHGTVVRQRAAGRRIR